MASVTTGTTSIEFGAHLRIGYKSHGSTDPFTYLTYFPSYNELPYTFSLPSGTWDVQYSQICATCSMPVYSDAEIVVVSVS